MSTHNLRFFVRVGIYIQRHVDSQLNKTEPSAVKRWSSPILNEQEQIAKSRASIQQEDRKNDSLSVDGFCSLCRTVLEVMGYFYDFCPCQEVHPSLSEEDFQHGSTKGELKELGRSYVQKSSNVV